MNIYGPVLSRRLGYSLGIDLFKDKACTQNCIYCQLGSGKTLPPIRKRFVDPEIIENELQKRLDELERVDYITFAGSGEPTLSVDLGRIITFIRNNYPDKKIAVITNSTMLFDATVREEIKSVDLVVPSLDAASEEIFQKINRPVEGLTFNQLVEGLIEFRKIYKGHFRLEVMLLNKINDTDEELIKMRALIEKIKPDEIDINTPIRPPAEEWVHLPIQEKINRAKEILGGKSISKHDKSSAPVNSKDDLLASKIVEFLKRRPEQMENITAALNVEHSEVENILLELLTDGTVYKKMINGLPYYLVHEKNN